MAFKPVKYNDGLVVELPLAASQTVAQYDALVWSSGSLATAAADAEVVDYVAIDANASSSAGDLLRVVPARTADILFEVDCTSNTAAAQRGTDVELTDKATLKNATAASANGFRIESLVGAAADKKVRGRFVAS